MRAVSGVACFIVGLAIIAPAFDVQATTEARDGFLRANPSNEVAGREDVDHRALATTTDQTLPMCDNGFTGVQDGNVCCSAECGTCSGAGCAGRPGGSEACCIRTILTSGSPCSEVTEAPCFIDNFTCSNGFPGIQTRDVCCPMECGRCGGAGCAGLPGGTQECCTSVILASGASCSEVGIAPCFIEGMMPTVTPTVMPTVTPNVMATGPPTVMPTVTPTVMPTVTPNVMATGTPSVMPTVTPSAMPTPSVMPTGDPSVMPTATPSVMPTPIVMVMGPPSVMPTMTPSGMPTPSVLPTGGPSVMPTATPSVMPTGTPTAMPTATPTVMPPIMALTAVSTCSNGFPGFQNGNVCCAVECGLCGGVGCSAAPGGQNSCCTSAIITNGDSCSDAGEAPCFL
ncbi:unnamed protein product [Ascophyllum nodosum]